MFRQNAEALTGAPVTTTAKNADRTWGESWQWVQRTARALGVPVHRQGRKAYIVTAELLTAMQSKPVETTDPAEAVRAALRGAP